MVYSSGSAVRDDISGPGTWAFLPARLADRRDRRGQCRLRAEHDAGSRASRIARWRGSSPASRSTLTGYLRFPEAGRRADARREDLAKRLWFTRDHLAMAAGAGLGQQVAPFYIDLESPVPASGIPKPGPLDVHLKDDHMQYAITWFALAGAVVIAFGVWWHGQRRSYGL